MLVVVQVVFVVLVNAVALLRLELPLPTSLAHHMPFGRVFPRKDPSTDFTSCRMVLFLGHELLVHMNNMSIDVTTPGERLVAPWPGARVFPFRFGWFTVPIRRAIMTTTIRVLVVVIVDILLQSNLLALGTALSAQAVHGCLLTRRRMNVSTLCSTHGFSSDCQPCACSVVGSRTRWDIRRH